MLMTVINKHAPVKELAEKRSLGLLQIYYVKRKTVLCYSQITS